MEERKNDLSHKPNLTLFWQLKEPYDSVVSNMRDPLLKISSEAKSKQDYDFYGISSGDKDFFF